MILHTSSSEAVALVAERINPLVGTRWTGVDGYGASGKTTLAGQLAASIEGSVVVHVDDFARLDVAGWERDRFVAQVLQPLLNGQPAHYERWDFVRNAGAGWVRIEPGVPIIVEGVSATDVRLGVPWDLTLWVDVPEPVRRRRIEERDGEALRERWLTDWIPMEEAYVRDQRPRERVDVVVDGAGDE